jgi:hypothetical protein
MMTFYNQIEPIFEYLLQIRKIENYLMFDMLFPMTWKVPKKYIIEDKFLNQGQQEDNKILLSFISDFQQKELDLIVKNIIGIINYNLEREEKERLLQVKINELKTIFDKQSLDNLKELKFDITKKIIEESNGTDSELVQTVIED